MSSEKAKYIALMVSILMTCSFVAISFAAEQAEQYRAPQSLDDGDAKVKPTMAAASVDRVASGSFNQEAGGELKSGSDNGSLSVTVTTENSSEPFIILEGE